MNKIPFQLVLEAPARVGDDSAIYRMDNGQLFISATRVRGIMRRHLRELLARQGVGSELEAEIFGEITANHATQSRFYLSDLLATGCEHLNNVASIGAIFNGEIFLNVLPRSAADFAIRLSLLAIQDLHRGVVCRIKISDNPALSQPCYQQKINSDENKAKGLQKFVDGLLISYFQTHLDKLNLIEPRKFEEFVASVLRSEGFEVELTPTTGDGGFDILAVQTSAVTGQHTYLIDCKRYAKHRKIGIEWIRHLIGVLQLNNATKGMIVTTTSFSRDARRLAEQCSNKIMLHDYDSLKRWVKSLDP